MDDALAFRRLLPSDGPALVAFFDDLSSSGDTKFFHPHPFTHDHAYLIASYPGRDLYAGAVAGGRILAYGLLRGWDQGYPVPSLGVALHPAARGTGLSRAFMSYLHSAARLRGSPRVRLKVYPENHAARRLYESLGYAFAEAAPDGQLVGVLDLGRGAKAA
jgi:GNAT superfamily N-acetyltransferase